MSSKKKIFLWSLYDFANSLAFANVAVYFSLWFVSDHRFSDSWISAIVAVVTVLLLFTLPVLGAISDARQRRMPFLIFLTIGSVTTLTLLGLIAIRTNEFSSLTLFAVVGLYFLFQYFYQASLSFYDAFLQDLSTGHSREKVSGIGMASGQLGNIVGLLILLPLANGTMQLWGLSGRSSVFIFAAVLFFIFSLPTLLWLKDTPKPALPHPEHKYFKETYQNLLRIRKYPGVLNYLITYYFFADAILTLQLFASLYLQEVGHLSDTQKVLATLAALIFAVVGSLISHRITKMFHGTKRTIKIFLLLWAFFLGLLALTTNQDAFIGLIVLNGFAFGVLFTLSRAYYSELAPKDRQGEFFGIYALFERAASVLGPIVWSVTAAIFASYGPDRYRFSVLSLAIIVLISFFTFHTGKHQSEPVIP